jgi:hypothetical protein
VLHNATSFTLQSAEQMNPMKTSSQKPIKKRKRRS